MGRVINAVCLIGVFGLGRAVLRADFVLSDRLLVVVRRKLDFGLRGHQLHDLARLIRVEFVRDDLLRQYVVDLSSFGGIGIHELEVRP